MEQLELTNDLEWFYNKYAQTVKRGKPSLRLANQLKLMIDATQIYYEVRNNTSK